LIDFELEETRVESATRVYAPAVIDPYKDQTPHELLSREFYLGTNTLVNDVISSFDLYPLLLGKLPANVLSLYRYFRYDAIELRAVFTVDPQTYGVVGISWQPFADLSTPLTDSQLSQMNLEYMHVSESSEMVYVLPYEHTQDFFHLGEASYINTRAFIWAMTPLAAVGGGTVTLDYSLYARFINPHLAGFVAQSFCGTAKTAAQVMSNFEHPYAKSGASMLKMAHDLMCGNSDSNASGTPGTTAGDSFTIGSEPLIPTAIKQSIYGDWNMTRYVRDSPYLGVEDRSYHPKSAMFGTQMADWTIPQIMQVPSLSQSGVFSTLTTTFSHSIYCTPSPTSVYADTYAAYLCQLYSFWRGSTKIKLVFTGSSLVTSRIAINVSWNPGGTPTLLNNSPSRIVTVRGPTEVEFSVPYLYPYPWCITTNVAANVLSAQGGDLNNHFYYPQLSLSVVNQQSPGSTFVTIPYLLFCAAGEDFEVKDLAYNNPQYDPDGFVTVASDKGTRKRAVFEGQGILDDFSKKFDVLGGESAPVSKRDPGEVHTVRQILSHWSRRQAGGFNLGPMFNAQTATKALYWQNGMFDFLSSIFVFTRFTLKVRTEVPTNPDPDVAYDDITVTMQTFGGYQTTVASSSMCPDPGYARYVVRFDPVLEFEAPFRCLSEMTTTWTARSPQPLPIQISTSLNTSPVLAGFTVCAGRDCEVSHLSYLPPMAQWPNL
jgi:hypothetical protein